MEGRSAGPTRARPGGPGDAEQVQRAIDESTQLLARSWSTWCAERGIDPSVDLHVLEPVVYQVGLALDQLEWVALIRFEADVAGRHLHGFVRGPLDDAVFEVRTRVHQHEDDTGHRHARRHRRSHRHR